jgi:hypothetical protein
VILREKTREMVMRRRAELLAHHGIEGMAWVDEAPLQYNAMLFEACREKGNSALAGIVTRHTDAITLDHLDTTKIVKVGKTPWPNISLGSTYGC